MRLSVRSARASLFDEEWSEEEEGSGRYFGAGLTRVNGVGLGGADGRGQNG